MFSLILKRTLLDDLDGLRSFRLAVRQLWSSDLGAKQMLHVRSDESK